MLTGLEPRHGLLPVLVDAGCTGRAAPAERVFPRRTSVPARFWNSRAMCSAMRPIHVPSRSRVMNPPRRPKEQAWSSRVGDERDQRIGEARDLGRREVLEGAQIDEQADDRLPGPVVRAAQDARLEDLQGRLGSAPDRRTPGRPGSGPCSARARNVVTPGPGAPRFRGLGHARPPASVASTSVYGGPIGVGTGGDGAGGCGGPGRRCVARSP